MDKSNLNDAMVLKITEIEACRNKAEVTIPAETIDKNMDNTVKEFVKQAKLPGFREGKAPKQIVKKRFQDNISQELLRKCHLTAFEKIREESKTDIVSMPTPEAEPEAPKPGEEYKFSLTFEVAPELKLPEYKGLKLKKPESKVTDKDIQEEMDRYREMYAEFATVKEPAEEGDMLKISFTSDLECPEDAIASYKRLVEAEDSWCWLNEPEMLPGIIKGLKGSKSGDTKKLKVEFPADFTEPLLSEKEGNYEIKVVEVQRRVPLTDDKELCKRLNLENIDALKTQLKSAKAAKEEQEGRVKLQNEALESIVKKVGKLDLPPSLLGQATQTQFRQIANELVKSEDDVEAFKKDTDKHRKVAEEAAKKRITDYFVAKEIAEAEGIQVEQKEIDDQIKGISAAYGYKEKDLRQQMESSGGFEELHMDLTISKVAGFIVENADLGEKKAETEEKTEKKK